MSECRIGLVGAGAVGSLIATALASRNEPFHWVVRNPQRRSSLPPLRALISGTGMQFGLETAGLCSSIEELPGGLEWLIVAVKSYDVDTVLAHRPPGVSYTLVVANGLLEGDFHLGLLYGGARVSSGVLTAAGPSRLMIGAMGNAPGQSLQIAAKLSATWLEVTAEPAISVAQWHKLAMNCAINPLTALLDCRNGDLPAYGTMPLITEVLSETCRVAQKVLGDAWCYSPADLVADCRELIRNTAENSSSMREDLRAGRRTESAMLNSAVAARGAGLGVDCPLNYHLGDMLFLLANKDAL